MRLPSKQRMRVRFPLPALQSVEVPIDRIEAYSSCENYPKRESGIAVGDSSYNRNRGLAQLVQ